MRNILLSVVVEAALVAAGVGGTLAGFSDYEVSEENFFKTGALDLTVSDYLGNEYNGEEVPAFWQISDAWPCCDKSVFFDLENWGQGFQKVPHVYVHFKNFECDWVMPKLIYAMVLCEDGVCDDVVYNPWDDPLTQDEIDALLELGYKPVNEPEFVAECGGIAGEDADGDPVEVDGIGCCFGEDCTLPEHIDVGIWVMGPWPHAQKPATAPALGDTRWTPVDLSDYDKNGDGVIKLNELECEQIELDGQMDDVIGLPNCNGIWVHIALHLQQLNDDDYGDYFPDGSKWEWWPTNALQKDAVRWNIGFELLQD